jgi:flagellar motor switch protein FliN/FliY
MTDEKDVQTPVESESQPEADQQEPVAQAVASGEETPDAGGTDGEAAMPPDDSPTPASEGDLSAEGGEEAESGGDGEADILAALEDLPQEEEKAEVDDINFSQTSVSKAEFQHLSQPAGNVEGRNIELLMDVNLPISIELGRTKMSISDILSLGPGSVVELNKLAGEPVDLLVNQKVVARGEVVVIDENFGVRITQLMTPEERLKSLGEES